MQTDVIAAPASRPAWRGLIGFNLLTGIVLGIVGFAVGAWLGGMIGDGLRWVGQSDENDIAIFLGFALGLVGYFGGLGFFNYPISRLLGHPPSLREYDSEGWGRYFRMCTDHKVVGIQYLVVILIFFFVAGFNAMMIRTELLRPSPSIWPADTYLTLVGEHGTMMMVLMSAAVIGPFGNYLIPIMIGARRMAFPRIESMTVWMTLAAPIVLLSAIGLGGFPTGWTGYTPLADQANLGMDSYITAFILAGTALTLVGFNILATVFTMRAPGMTWGRLPLFVWAQVATAILMLLSAPVLVTALLLAVLDRTATTTFFTSGNGGSPYLFENLFWFFGHPEVYILALPGFGVALEILPVFCRKPLWGYGMAVAGMLGIAALSFMVWQHHLFVSGINAPLRPFYMLTTELISVPTGFLFINAMGTLWNARMRLEVPLLFVLAQLFNFLIGGLSGIFLSDTPSDVTLHGSYFVMAHLHYTILGGLGFSLFAAFYYWFPKMTGLQYNMRLARIHFWSVFILFNTTFAPLFAAGILDMPRRAVTYASYLQPINDWVSISAFLLGGSMLLFGINVVYSWAIARKPAVDNPWHSRGIEWQLPTPVPVHNFERLPVIVAGPYDYGVPGALPVMQPEAAAAPAGGE